MGTKEVPQHWITTCDCCKKEESMTHKGKPKGWIAIRVEQDALDFQGEPVADGSINLLLCGRCGGKVITGMNLAVVEVMEVMEKLNKPKETTA